MAVSLTLAADAFDSTEGVNAMIDKTFFSSTSREICDAQSISRAENDGSDTVFSTTPSRRRLSLHGDVRAMMQYVD